jgi:hypothetical protein
MTSAIGYAAGYGVSALARVGFLFASGFGAFVTVLAIGRLGKGVRTAPCDALTTLAFATRLQSR